MPSQKSMGTTIARVINDPNLRSFFHVFRSRYSLSAELAERRDRPDGSLVKMRLLDVRPSRVVDGRQIEEAGGHALDIVDVRGCLSIGHLAKVGDAFIPSITQSKKGLFTVRHRAQVPEWDILRPIHETKTSSKEDALVIPCRVPPHRRRLSPVSDTIRDVSVRRSAARLEPGGRRVK